MEYSSFSKGKPTSDLTAGHDVPEAMVYILMPDMLNVFLFNNIYGHNVQNNFLFSFRQDQCELKPTQSQENKAENATEEVHNTIIT